MSNDIVLYSPQQVIAATYHKPEVVEAERKKKADAEIKIASLKEGINSLKQTN